MTIFYEYFFTSNHILKMIGGTHEYFTKDNFKIIYVFVAVCALVNILIFFADLRLGDKRRIE